MVVSICSIVCCLMLLGWVIYVVYNFATSDKEECIKYIRSYKKGSFTVPLFPGFLIYLIGGIYSKGFNLRVFFESFASIVSLATLKYDFGSLEGLMEANKVFRDSVYFCFSVITANTVLLACSVMQQLFHFWRKTLKRRFVFLFSRNLCFIYGKNARSLKMYESDDRNYCPEKYIIDEFPSGGDDELFPKGISYANCLSLGKEAEWVGRFLSRKEKEIKRIRNRCEFFLGINKETDARWDEFNSKLKKDADELRDKRKAHIEEKAEEKGLDTQWTDYQKQRKNCVFALGGSPEKQKELQNELSDIEKLWKEFWNEIDSSTKKEFEEDWKNYLDEEKKTIEEKAKKNNESLREIENDINKAMNLLFRNKEGREALLKRFWKKQEDDLNKEFKRLVQKDIEEPDKEFLKKEKAKLEDLYLEEKGFRKNEFIIIVNFEKDDRNISLCRLLSDTIRTVHSRHEDKPENLNYLFNKLSIYVFGDDELDSIYEEIESRTFGCMHFINKYKAIGMNVLRDYPVTRFMDAKQIDYEKAALKEGVRMTFSMIGFGKTNRRLFSDLVSDCQFRILGSDGETSRDYAPEFYIYDKNRNIYTADLNHNYFRYKVFYDTMKKRDEYLPIVNPPADVYPVSDCDINSPEFYDNLKKCFMRYGNGIHFVYIAFGTDLQNIELAKKLYDKKNEWGISDLFIFVKVNSLERPTSEYLLDEDRVCFNIYGEDDEIYSFRNVISTDVYKLASYCDSIYEDISERTDPEDVRVSEVRLSRKWFNRKKFEFDRLSSLAQGISIVNKLGMLGLEICDKSDGISSDIYDSLYMNNEMARKNLTEAEHQRWNAFMICNGYVPSTKAQIRKYDPRNDVQKEEKKKEEHKERHHGNITSIDGLVLFKKELADAFRAEDKKKGKTIDPDEFDVIKYDVCLMDNCYDVIGKMGKGLKLKTTKTEEGSLPQPV